MGNLYMYAYMYVFCTHVTTLLGILYTSTYVSQMYAYLWAYCDQKVDRVGKLHMYAHLYVYVYMYMLVGTCPAFVSVSTGGKTYMYTYIQCQLVRVGR